MKADRNIKQKIWDFLAGGLWTDGLKVFFAYWRSWLFGAAVFALVLTGVDAVGKFLVLGVWWNLVPLSIDAGLTYFFIACFLYQEPLGNKAIRPNAKQFARVFGYLLLVDLLQAVLVMIPFIGVYLRDFYPAFPGLEWAKPLGKVLFLWIGLRLLPVGPLAAGEVAAPIMKSLILTRGNLGRLAVNGGMLALMIVPYFLLEKLNVGFVNNALNVIAIGVYSAFACAATRILNGEHIAARLGQDRRAVGRDKN